MVDLEQVEQEEDIRELREMISQHLAYTGSTVAARVLADFDKLRPQFVKVMPIDYRRALEQKRRRDTEPAMRD